MLHFGQYIYIFGNLSKYICAKPTSFTAHHLVYIPKVSYWSMNLCELKLTKTATYSQIADTIQDVYHAKFEKSAMAAVLTHCKHELMHASIIANIIHSTWTAN